MLITGLPKKQKGSCLCGKVVFEVAPPSRFCSHCHCVNCRKAHGAAFVTYLGVPSKQLKIKTGKIALKAYRYGYAYKGKKIVSTRTFCGQCGSSLFFESSRWPGEVHVAAGNMDGKIDKKPMLHFYYDQRPAWSKVHDALPKYGGPTGGKRLDRVPERS